MKEKNYDLNLGKWGPYNKEYLGVCHVADETRGATFNVELFPGFFRRSVMVSHSICDNGLKMWGANAGLTHFCYRYELQWKDEVYCDTEFIIRNDKRCDICCTFVNHTELPQSVNMNLCASLQYPTIKTGGNPRYRAVYRAVLPKECIFVDAAEYDEINCAETLASDGLYLGEKVMESATGTGSVIRGSCFWKPEHYLRYRVSQSADSVGIRYQCEEDTELKIVIDGEVYMLELAATDTFAYTTVSFEKTKVHTVGIFPAGKAVTVDCLCLGAGAERTEFEEIPRNFEPERLMQDNKLSLKYKDIDYIYTVEWQEPVQKVRAFYGMDIGQMLQQRIHEHVATVLRGRGEGVYENILTDPVFLSPGEEKKIHFSVICDKYTDAEAATVYCSGKNDHDMEMIQPFYTVRSNPDGEKFAFSQNMMAYNTFLNVVYPIYTRRGYIRHNTPGRNWDSLYSWDSGFIGMGLGTADFERAYDCLNTYLTPAGDMHSPYIFHGSVVPTQIFLYKYLLDKYPENRECLKRQYPMVRQMYDFYSNLEKEDGQMNSGLLKTWHIFYNSGGWDDYPPQDFLRLASKSGNGPATWQNTTPVITTALVVLIAKIMRMIAEELGIDDRAEYDNAIEKYTAALQNGLWDAECGYFSYMIHDENGAPKEFLRAADGSNFNMGFDGIYPYIAGSTSEEQEQQILSNIENGLMTEIGVGVVDKRASYYSQSGYWNGSVWMPHQWILWKALLDNGETEMAKEIADKALTIWKKEVDETYCCFEHFMTVNGRGSGFHQFSGLSTPVLMFFESYYSPGSVTFGFLTIMEEQQWNEERTAVDFTCTVWNEKGVAIVCLASDHNYRFVVNGNAVTAKKITEGAYEVPLSKGKCRVKVISKETNENV